MTQSVRVPGRLSFEDLLQPLSPRRFFERHWEKSPLHLSRDDPALFRELYRDLFSLADLDRCLAIARQGTQKLVTVIPPPGSDRRAEHLAAGDAAVVDLYRAFLAGDTIRLRSIETLWPPLAELAARVGTALSARVQLNLYLTPARAQGFDVHFDTHDVFILQLEGTKDWSIYEPKYRLPFEDLDHPQLLEPETGPQFIDRRQADLIERIRLTPGDLLYLPRGFFHEAVTEESFSAHLTAGVHPVYWLDFVKTAAELAAIRHPSWRRALPPGFVADDAARDAMAADFAALLDSLSEDDLFARALDVVIDDRLDAQELPADGHFAVLARLDELRPDSLLERRANLDCAVRRRGRQASIHFAGQQMHGPRSIGRALDFVRDTLCFRISELPGLSAESQLVLARRLVREGLLRPATKNAPDP